MKFIVKTFEGLEEVLCSELNEKGFLNPKPLRRAVSFIGNLEDLYKANYTLSLGLRILQQISYSRVENEKQFYDYLFQIPKPKML